MGYLWEVVLRGMCLWLSRHWGKTFRSSTWRVDSVTKDSFGPMTHIYFYSEFWYVQAWNRACSKLIELWLQFPAVCCSLQGSGVFAESSVQFPESFAYNIVCVFSKALIFIASSATVTFLPFSVILFWPASGRSERLAAPGKALRSAFLRSCACARVECMRALTSVRRLLAFLHTKCQRDTCSCSQKVSPGIWRVSESCNTLERCWPTWHKRNTWLTTNLETKPRISMPPNLPNAQISPTRWNGSCDILARMTDVDLFKRQVWLSATKDFYRWSRKQKLMISVHFVPKHLFKFSFACVSFVDVSLSCFTKTCILATIGGFEG